MRERIWALMGGFALGLVAGSANAQPVPSRYSGAFPDTPFAKNISGTLNGQRLTLNYLFRGQIPTQGTYSCAAAGPGYLTCNGTWRTANGQGAGNGAVNITFQGGQPVTVTFQ
jgi:hypothetical protein